MFNAGNGAIAAFPAASGNQAMGQQLLDTWAAGPMPAYDPYLLSSLLGTNMPSQMYNQLIAGLQQQWLHDNNFTFSPYTQTIDNHNRLNTTYTQSGNYGLAPEQLSEMRRLGYITGFDPRTNQTIGNSQFYTGKQVHQPGEVKIWPNQSWYGR